MTTTPTTPFDLGSDPLLTLIKKCDIGDTSALYNPYLTALAEAAPSATGLDNHLKHLGWPNAVRELGRNLARVRYHHTGPDRPSSKSWEKLTTPKDRLSEAMFRFSPVNLDIPAGCTKESFPKELEFSTGVRIAHAERSMEFWPFLLREFRMDRANTIDARGYRIWRFDDIEEFPTPPSGMPTAHEFRQITNDGTGYVQWLFLSSSEGGGVLFIGNGAYRIFGACVLTEPDNDYPVLYKTLFIENTQLAESLKVIVRLDAGPTPGPGLPMGTVSYSATLPVTNISEFHMDMEFEIQPTPDTFMDLAAHRTDSGDLFSFRVNEPHEGSQGASILGLSAETEASAMLNRAQRIWSGDQDVRLNAVLGTRILIDPPPMLFDLLYPPKET